jgi:hypothetical protein
MTSQLYEAQVEVRVLVLEIKPISSIYECILLVKQRMHATMINGVIWVHLLRGITLRRYQPGDKFVSVHFATYGCCFARQGM